MKFEVGSRYSREQIQHELGGEIQSYLPQHGGKIVAGCFAVKMNPDAPFEIQVGDAPKVKEKAKLLKQCGNTIPVFLKSKRRGFTEGIWEYLGLYKCSELIDDPEMIRQAEEKSGRQGIIFLLRLERISEKND